MENQQTQPLPTESVAPKKRGRPKGSKNQLTKLKELDQKLDKQRKPTRYQRAKLLSIMMGEGKQTQNPQPEIPEVEVVLYKFRQADGTWKVGPHPNQKEIIDDHHRFKVVVCGRRFGKTSFAVNELLFNALTIENGIFWYVGPTYRQAKMIAWGMLEEILGTLPTDLVSKKNENELIVTFSNGSKIEIKGSDNEDSLRGVKLNGVVLDEFAFMKPYVFDRIIRPMLADLRGWALMIGTPKGYNHFYEFYLRGQKENREWKSWRFKSSDNPYLHPEEIEAARKDNEEKGTPEIFAQEWEADFRQFKGLVYKSFDPNIHVSEFEPNPSWTFYQGMDFGTSNPTVNLWLGIDKDDSIWVFDEYYQSGFSIDYHAGNIKARYPQYNPRAVFGDPSALSEHIEYANWQLYITPATRFFQSDKGTTDSWVRAGINMVQEKLRIDPVNKRPKLIIHPRCKNLIREFQAYEYDELKGYLSDKPKKINDHALDALRYVICSYGGIQKPEPRYHYVPQNETTGY